MSSRSVTWRRAAAAVVATATVAAGVPLLLSATSASAAPATRLVLEQADGRTTAAAGTCTEFTIRPTDAFGSNANSATVTVEITEVPESDVHDVDFCIVDGNTPWHVRAPKYGNEEATNPEAPDAAVLGETQEYAAGPGISEVPAHSQQQPAGSPAPKPFNNPDSRDNANSTQDPQQDVNNNKNPTGRDTVSFRSDGGTIRFGVAGLLPGAAATVFAYVDDGTFQSRNNNFLENGDLDTTDPGDDNVTATRRVTFTAGGTGGSVEANDAVRRVELTPENSFAAKPSASGSATHSFGVTAYNGAGDLVGFAFPSLVVTSGPNTGATSNTSCTSTGNEGQPAVCTLTTFEPGNDVVTAFFNQSAGTPTGGLDPAEPRDTAVATTTLPASTNPAVARTLDLTPASASISAGQSQQFVAAVTDVNGGPVNNVSVTFTEAGPGSLQGGSSGANGTSSVTVTTTGAGRAAVTFLTSPGQTGTNTLTAVISTSGTQCTAANSCSDSSAVTVTASAASPSPRASTSASPRPSTSGSPQATPTASTSTSPSTAGSRYRGLASPVRVLDTRENNGVRRSGEIVLDLSQRLNDAEATAAVLNVTVTNPTARGFLVAYPNGNTKPGTSNVNFETAQTQANEVVVGLSSSKRVSLFVDSASAHVIVDLVGSFTRDTGADTGRVVTNAPSRAFDSRTTATPRRTGEVVVNLSDRLPNGATDAILNVTVQGPSARGYVVAFPSGTTRPGTSNVNFERGQTQANEVVTRVGTGSNAGRVSLFIDSASSALIVDVVGAVVSSATGAQSFTALEQPVRALDTRSSNGARRSGEVTVAMPSSVPSSATGVILNVTATNGTRSGFVAVYPAGSANPGTSNVNFPTNLTQANEVTTRLGTNRSVTLFVGGSGTPAAHLIVDVVGYLTS